MAVEFQPHVEFLAHHLDRYYLISLELYGLSYAIEIFMGWHQGHVITLL